MIILDQLLIGFDINKTLTNSLLFRVLDCGWGVVTAREAVFVPGVQGNCVIEADDTDGDVLNGVKL